MRLVLPRQVRYLGLFVSLHLGLLAFSPDEQGGVSILPADWATLVQNAIGDGSDFGVTPGASDSLAGSIQAATKRAYDHWWDAEVAVPVKVAVQKGDVLWLRLRARTISARNEQGEAEVTAYFQRAAPPWEKSLEHRFSVGREWADLEIPFVSRESYEAGRASLNLGFGFRIQEVEIADLELWKFPRGYPIKALPHTRYTYEGREPDAAWREEALQRIEKIRTSPLTVTVLDAEGRPAAGARVSVRQTRSAFQWGSSVDSTKILEKSDDGRRYREALLEFFDTAVIENGLKWPCWSNDTPTETWPRSGTLRALDWLEAQNLRLRGHNLVWPSWQYTPRRFTAEAVGAEEFRRLQLAHIRDLMGATWGRIESWDVVNESLHERAYFDAVPEEEAMVEWFRAARAADPKPRLFLNDFEILTGGTSRAVTERYLAQVERLEKLGVQVDGLGVQGHFGQAIPPVQTILADLDLLATAGRPILITEFDVNTPDEQLLADFTRDFLLLCYSHPGVNGVILWGYWESAHWCPRSAMFRADWSERPHAEVWREWVVRRWRTRADGISDKSGRWSAPVHHGDYLIEVQTGDRIETRRITVGPEGGDAVVFLPLHF